MYEKILVPLDGYKTAETILPNLVKLACESKVKVVLFTVEPPGPTASRTGTSRSGLGDGVATLQKPDARMKAYLDSATSMLAEDGVKATGTVATGDAAEEIPAYAAEHECDLIAMSTRGYSALHRGLMGSVTDAVVRTSRVPVLTVGPKSIKGKDLDGAIWKRGRAAGRLGYGGNGPAPRGKVGPATIFGNGPAPSRPRGAPVLRGPRGDAPGHCQN